VEQMNKYLLKIFLILGLVLGMGFVFLALLDTMYAYSLGGSATFYYNKYGENLFEMIILLPGILIVLSFALYIILRKIR
jgi:hypothetical protein